MAESVDKYVDQFHINMGIYGCALNFLLSTSTPPAPGTPPHSEPVATIRMSLEHLKLMIFILHRQVEQFERQMKISIPIPLGALVSLQIRQEDWQTFWQAQQEMD